MYYYRVTIAYKGTNYRGWQAQADGRKDCLPTVQGTIAQVLQGMSKYQECSITGTSRTDAGVHAQGQLGKISLPRNIEPAKLLLGLNCLLPRDIRIQSCEFCEASFNPKNCSVGKAYHYYFSDMPQGNPLTSDIVAKVPGPLNWNILQKSTQVFVGKHDFYSFSKRNAQVATTVREIYRCELRRVDLASLGGVVYCIEIQGDGFLKQMVRYMVATLFAVARLEISEEKVREYLEHHYDEKLCPKAKAHGLHLMHIQSKKIA